MQNFKHFSQKHRGVHIFVEGYLHMNINLEWYALYYLVECKRKETNSFDKKSVFSVSKNKCTKIAREI